MIRSALLALDSTEASRRSLEVALDFCKRQGEKRRGIGRPVKLTGVAVVDTPTILRAEAMPVGAGVFKAERDETILAVAETKVTEILDEFEARCEEAGVPHEAVRGEGLPREQIELASRRHDLILIGKDTNFHFATTNSRDETLKRLLRDNPRPVVVGSDRVPEGHNVVILYDGSLQASHTLLMWILLELRFDETQIHVLSVARREEAAARCCEEACALLRHHDIPALMHPIASREKIADVLHEHIEPLDPQIVVMGAFGEGGLRSRLFGDVTMEMVRRCPFPLFLCR